MADVAGELEALILLAVPGEADRCRRGCQWPIWASMTLGSFLSPMPSEPAATGRHGTTRRSPGFAS